MVIDNLKQIIYKKDSVEQKSLSNFLLNTSKLYYSNFKKSRNEEESNIIFNELYNDIESFLLNGYGMLQPIELFTLGINDMVINDYKTIDIVNKLTNEIIHDLQESNMIF